MYRAWAIVVVAAAVFSGCFLFGKREPPPTMRMPPEAASFPLEWQPPILIDQAYPPQPGTTEEQRGVAGRDFLQRHARVRGDTIAVLDGLAWAESDGEGDCAAFAVALKPADNGNWKLQLQASRFDSEHAVTMIVDDSFRLLDYTARSARLYASSDADSLEQVSWLRAAWNGTTNTYTIVDTLKRERVLKTDGPQVPEDIAPLLCLLAPTNALQADFPIISCALGGLYRMSLEVLPRHGGAEAPPALIRARTLTPLGETWEFSVGGSTAFTFGVRGGRARLRPADSAWCERVQKLGRFVRQERDRLVLIGEEADKHMKECSLVASRLTSNGRKIDGSGKTPQPQQFATESWLSIPVAPLEVGLGRESGGSAGRLLELADSGDLNGGPARGSATLPVSGRRTLSVSLDVLPPGLDLDGYAQACTAAAMQKGQIAGYASSVLLLHGNLRAVRIDLNLNSSTRAGSATVFHRSLLLTQRNGVVIRLDFSASEEHAQDWWGALAKVYAGLRVGNPPIG